MNTIRLAYPYHNMVRDVDYQVLNEQKDYFVLKNSPGTIYIPHFLEDLDHSYQTPIVAEEEEEYMGAI